MTERIYIALMVVVLLSVTEAAIPHKQCQLICTRIGFPVCGSDGRTYGNPCELRAENCLKSPYLQVTLVRNGSCDTSNPTTYTQTQSRATPTECTLACSKEYAQVCGSDGRTYSNACQVRARNCRGSPYNQITIVSNGTCETTKTYPTTTQVTPPRACPDVCTAIADPVCGSDGVTYGNPCLLGIENCKRSPNDQVVVVRNGSCDTTTTAATPSAYPQKEPVGPPDACPLACTLELNEVCGSDGVTYGNPCQLRVGNCYRSPYDQVVLVRNGSCDTTATNYQQAVPRPIPTECTLACTEEYAPVCGSDGRTHSNACQVRVSNCQGSPYNQITIVSNGTCETTQTTTYPTTEQVNGPEPCPLACTRELNQVCGSDGVTYNNPCLLRVSNCQRSPYDQVVLVRNGSCDTTPTTYRQDAPVPLPTECTLVCTAIYSPVCGSDESTYSNACQLRVSNCQGSPYSQVTIVSNGDCTTTTTTATTTTYPTAYP